MTFSLRDIVPWGRTCDEYIAMFALSTSDLEGRILGAGDGPAAFNAELTRRGGQVPVPYEFQRGGNQMLRVARAPSV